MQRASRGLAGLLVLLAGCSLLNRGSTPGEPAYCSPDAFAARESPAVAAGLPGLVRLRVFRLGDAVVAGLAVGSSDVASVRALSQRNSPAAAAEGFCTWYVNKGNPEAAATFNHRYVEDPRAFTATTAPTAYLDLLAGSFADGQPSFLSCVRDRGYLAIGCDGQMHRGPTVFGMLLAYSGCSPENAAAIVNGLWGLNGIAPELRLAILRAAYGEGRAHPGQADALGALLSGR